MRYRNSQPRSNDGPWARQPSSRDGVVDISRLLGGCSEIRRPTSRLVHILPELELLTLYQRDIAYIGVVLQLVEGYVGPINVDLADVLLEAFPAVRDYERESHLNSSRPTDSDLTNGLVSDVMRLDSTKIHSQYGRMLGNVVDYMQNVCGNM